MANIEIKNYVNTKKLKREERIKKAKARQMDFSKLDNDMAKMLMETINNMLIELYAAMAQSEIEKKEKRQREGIEAKRARGEWSEYGRPSAVDIEDFKIQYQKVVDGQMRPTELMKQLGISKSTFYRYVERVKA